jgi:hypothetical protein
MSRTCVVPVSSPNGPTNWQPKQGITGEPVGDHACRLNDVPSILYRSTSVMAV